MNPNDLTEKDELITHWIDGELTDADSRDFKQRMDSEADFAAEVKAASATSERLAELMRAEFPASLDPPSPELFNARIMSHVQAEGAGDQAPDADNLVRPDKSIWSNVPWLIAAAAMVVAAFVYVQQRPANDRTRVIVSSQVSNTYAPRAGVEIRTRFVPEVGATVVSLEGLESVPSDHEIVGELVASYLPAGPWDAPVLASVESGEPVFVIHTNQNSVPSVLRLPNN